MVRGLSHTAMLIKAQQCREHGVALTWIKKQDARLSGDTGIGTREGRQEHIDRQTEADTQTQADGLENKAKAGSRRRMLTNRVTDRHRQRLRQRQVQSFACSGGFP